MAGGWSDELVQQTRKLLDSGGLSPARNGSYHFKNSDGRFGTIDEGDLITGHYRIRTMRSGDEQEFADTDALIAAGWAVD